MTKGRDLTGCRAVMAMLALVAAAAAGCTDSRLLTGVYRSSPPAPAPATPGTIEGVAGLEGDVYVELVLGQYGTDVVGIIRFFSNRDFTDRIGGTCNCRFLTEGRFDGQFLVFAFTNPSPCAAALTDLIHARLAESGGGDTLEGPVGKDIDGAVPPPSFRFERITTAGDLGATNKVCDETAGVTPADSGPGDEAPDVGEGAE